MVAPVPDRDLLLMDLVKANTELAELDGPAQDRIAWIIEQIADGGYAPAEPGRPWAGQGDVIRRVIEEFKLDESTATSLVDAAQVHLYGTDDSGPVHVDRKLLKTRLHIIRRLVLRGVKDPKKVITSKIKRRKNPDGTYVRVSVPVKETVRHSMDVNFVRLLIDIEGMIAQLDHLDKSGASGETVAAIFQKLEQHADGSATQQTMTIKKKLEGIDVNKFSGAGREVIEQAIAQEKRKRVNSKDVTGVDHEKDEERLP